MFGQCKKQTVGKWIVGMAAKERSWALGIHFVLRGQQYKDILGKRAVQGGLGVPKLHLI